jgi:hypothetical protein
VYEAGLFLLDGSAEDSIGITVSGPRSRYRFKQRFTR